MNSANVPLKSSQIVQVPWNDRWTVYHRLQELEISCYCSSNQPLEVQLSSPTAVIQLWSVVKHCLASRQELIQWLQTCWDLKKT